VKEELLELGFISVLNEYETEYIIFSLGFDMVLEIPKETRKLAKSLATKGVYYLKSDKAVAMYNKLIDRGNVVIGLFHSTC
jgi:hypothetical protein